MILQLAKGHESGQLVKAISAYDKAFKIIVSFQNAFRYNLCKNISVIF